MGTILCITSQHDVKYCLLFPTPPKWNGGIQKAPVHHSTHLSKFIHFPKYSVNHVHQIIHVGPPYICQK